MHTFSSYICLNMVWMCVCLYIGISVCGCKRHFWPFTLSNYVIQQIISPSDASTWVAHGGVQMSVKWQLNSIISAIIIFIVIIIIIYPYGVSGNILLCLHFALLVAKRKSVSLWKQIKWVGQTWKTAVNKKRWGVLDGKAKNKEQKEKDLK